MTSSLSAVAYLGAAILFILCLGGLSNQETSRRGNAYGMVGMAIAVLATIFGPHVTAAGLPFIIGAMVVGATIGLYAARIVQMTQMPELVALMHSLVGLAAVIVGYANFIDPAVAAGLTPAENGIHEIEMYVGVLIGAVTFSGSLIAFGKLSGQDRRQAAAAAGAPLDQPHRPAAGDRLRLALRHRARRAGRDAADGGDDAGGAAVRRAHGDGDRRRRHAGGGVDAQQLLRLGGGRHRLHAVQRPADRHRRAGRLERRDPVVHHVQRDEPQLHQRDRRRLRHRQRRRGNEWRGAAGRRGPSDQRRRDRGNAEGRQGRHHRAGLRHGGGAGAAHGLRDHQAAARARRAACASASIRWRVACRAT